MHYRLIRTDPWDPVLIAGVRLATYWQQNGEAEVRKILIIDDHWGVRDTLRMILGRRPVQVDEAMNGPEALHRLEDRVYDLILLDLKMPYLEGLDFLEQARLMKVETPVMIISAYLSTDALPRAFRLGVVDFLPKPVDMETFLSVVDDVLLRSEELATGVDPMSLPGEGKLRRAKALIQRRRFQEARGLLPVVPGVADSTPEALMLAGMIAEIYGDFEGAAAAYKKTVKDLDPLAKSGCGWLEAVP